MAIFLTGCREEPNSQILTKEGYYYQYIDNLFGVQPSQDRKSFWYSNLSEAGFIDSLGRRNPLLKLPANDTNVIQIRIFPYSNDGAFFVASSSSATDQCHSNVYSAHMQQGLKEILKCLRPVYTIDPGISVRGAFGAVYTDKKIITFSPSGILDTITLQEPARFPSINLLPDSSIGVHFGKHLNIFDKSGELVFKHPTATSLPGYELYGDNTNQIIVEDGGEEKGMKFTEMGGTSKVVLPGAKIEKAIVSGKGQYLIVVNSKGSAYDCILYGPKGNQVASLSLHDFPEIEKDKHSDNFWISTADSLHYLTAETGFVTTKEIKHNSEDVIPVNTGKCLVMGHDRKLLLFDAANNTTAYLPEINVNIRRIRVSDNGLFSIISNENEIFAHDSDGNPLNGGKAIFTRGGGSIVGSGDNTSLMLSTELGEFYLTDVKRIPFEMRSSPDKKNNIELEINKYGEIDFTKGATLTIETFDESDNSVGMNTHTLASLNDSENNFLIPIPFQKGYEIDDSQNYSVRLQYSQGPYSNLRFSLSGIKYQTPLLRNKKVLSLLVLALVCVVIVASQYLSHSKPQVSRWTPILVWVFSTGTIAGANESMMEYLDVPILIFGLLFIVIGAFAMGVIKPSFYKQLVGMEPFMAAALPVITIPWFRKKYFKEYLEYLKQSSFFDNTALDDTESSGKYVAVPARVESSNGELIHENPAQYIVEQLASSSGQQAAPCINITGSGGLGKSALLRETIEQYLKLLEENPRLPIPVFIRSKEKNPPEMKELIKEALGRFILSADILEHELEASNYLIIIDGLSESNIEPATIGDFVSPLNAQGHKTPVLVTSRPDANYIQALRQSNNLITIHPQKLNEDIVRKFEESYLGEGNTLPEKIRKICRSQDGFYQPILVRLATIVKEDEDIDIVELYERTATTLIKKKYGGEEFRVLMKELCTICEATYGQRGMREIPYKEPYVETLDKLVQTGLVHCSIITNRVRQRTAAYRLIHDSLQTYLAIRPQLAQDKINYEELLYNYATLPRFKKDVSGLFFEGGSEMYQMAILMFSKYESDLVQGALKTFLLTQGEKLKLRLSIEDVLRSVPQRVRQEISTEKMESLLSVLTLCVQRCERDLFDLAVFYYNFAQIVCEKEQQ